MGFDTLPLTLMEKHHLSGILGCSIAMPALLVLNNPSIYPLVNEHNELENHNV